VSTNTTREKRIEDMLSFLLEHEGLLDAFVSFRDEHTEEFTQIENLEIRKYRRLARCEEKLDLYLKHKGILDQYNKIKLSKMKSDIMRRRDYALLSENDQDLKSRAASFYANLKRIEGEPVLFEKKWVYIDPPALRNKSVVV
jgi:hypothetical protein